MDIYQATVKIEYHANGSQADMTAHFMAESINDAFVRAQELFNHACDIKDMSHLSSTIVNLSVGKLSGINNEEVIRNEV